MKAILISIRPQWVEKILNGIKKDEIRKGTAIGKAINRLIEEQGVAPMLIYCTHGRHLLDLRKEDTKDNYRLTTQNKSNNVRWSYPPLLNGKVVARFNATADKFEWDSCARDNDGYWLENGNKLDLKPTCLSYEELFDYIKGGEGTAIHIQDLEIFDKPKEISEFNAYCKGEMKCLHCKHHWTDDSSGYSIDKCGRKPLTRAPQSFCFIEIE